MGTLSNTQKSAPVEKQKLTTDDDLAVATTEVEEVSTRGGRRKQKVTVPEKCSICESGTEVDYKDVYKLKRFTSRRGRMIPRSRSGLCSTHQRRVATAIKRARHMALLPFVTEE